MTTLEHLSLELRNKIFEEREHLSDLEAGPVINLLKVNECFESRVDWCLFYQYIRALGWNRGGKQITPLGVELGIAAFKLQKMIVIAFGFEDDDDAFFYCEEKLGPCCDMYGDRAYHSINEPPCVIRKFIDETFPKLKLCKKFGSLDKSLHKWFGTPLVSSGQKRAVRFKVTKLKNPRCTLIGLDLIKTCPKLKYKGQKHQHRCGNKIYKNGVCLGHYKYGSI